MMSRVLAMVCALLLPTYALANEPRLLLEAIDVALTPANLASAGVDEAYATPLARDVTARRYVRIRAAGALGILGSPTARQTLEALAAGDPDVEVRVQAARSVAHVFGPREPSRVAAWLRSLRPAAPADLDAILAAEAARLEPAPATPVQAR